MKHASEDIRNLAISLYKSGYTQNQVAKIVGYHYKTIYNWLKADAEDRPQKPLKKGHPPRALSEKDKADLKELIDSGVCHSLDEITETFARASRSVIYRAIIELGYTYKKNSFCHPEIQRRGKTRT